MRRPVSASTTSDVCPHATAGTMPSKYWRSLVRFSAKPWLTTDRLSLMPIAAHLLAS